MLFSVIIDFYCKFLLVDMTCHTSVSDELELVGCFGLNGPFRQYFSLYRAVSQREGEEKRNDRREKKNV